MDIHLERGMHCVDCHFVQDKHGNTKLYGEVRAAIEIACIDCHGGYGYAEEFDIERKFRESRLYKTAPINNNLVLAYVGQHVLGMPRSY